ncbi:MAG: SDR family oxidoreductase [Minicystis sp.]
MTGASAGIGREIARVLAREVGTLVLTARREDRLAELAGDLVAKHPGLRVIVRAVDLLDRGATGAMLDGLEKDGVGVDVLVNNAGFGDYGLFERTGWTKTEEMLELNVVSATFLLHRLVPAMVGRGFGAILNVGSTAGMFPSPALGVYSATKAYVNLLSEALHAELHGTGVAVTVLCPGPVPTEFQAVAGTTGKNPMPKAFHIDAEQCAEEAVTALKAGHARCIPGTAVRAAMLSVEALPKPVARQVAIRMAKRARGG